MGLKADLSDKERTILLQFLLSSCKGDGSTKHGVIKEAAEKFGVCRKTVSRLWRSANQQRREGESIMVEAKRKGRFMPHKWEIDYSKIEQLPHEQRGTIVSMSKALKIPKTQIGKWAKNLLRPHTNAIKPLLTAHNMISRLIFCLNAIHYDFSVNKLKFKPMENTIHIDEKWFYLTRKSCRYYMTPTEVDPLRVCQSKNHLPKVMFMCAVSRPVFDAQGSLLFDGKIGIWPFIEEVTAKRDSCNRKRGTKEMKPIQAVTRKVIKDCFINQIVPAIKAKWPECLSKHIKVQQDNARPHINNEDPEFQEVANKDGFQIQIIQQPPNSPDCNVNDLGFFNAIQSLQQRERCKTHEDLIEAVKNSFNMQEPTTLNKVFLSLQNVQIEIIKVRGTNNYKIPHMNKDMLIRQGILPLNLDVPEYLVRDVIDYLIGEEKTQDIQILMEEMGIIVPQETDGIPDLNN